MTANGLKMWYELTTFLIFLVKQGIQDNDIPKCAKEDAIAANQTAEPTGPAFDKDVP